MSETIVVGYDGQERSEHVLERAIETVEADGGKLIVVVAEELPPEPYLSAAGLGPYDSSRYVQPVGLAEVHGRNGSATARKPLARADHTSRTIFTGP